MPQSVSSVVKFIFGERSVDAKKVILFLRFGLFKFVSSSECILTVYVLKQDVDLNKLI